MSVSNDPRRKVMRALRMARRAYEDLTDMLTAEIARLGGDGLDTLGDAKDRMNLILAHQKALQTVMEFESRVERSLAERIGTGVGELDLDRARREILGGLARLSAAGDG